MADNGKVEVAREGMPTGVYISRDRVDGERFGHCKCCEDEYAIPMAELDRNDGFCDEHRGEFDPVDEEEAEDRESYVENINKNY